MRFTGKLVAPRFDLDEYRTRLDAEMKKAIRAGLREWLEAALAPIPNWSGASRATFTVLAEAAGISTGAVGGGVALGQMLSQCKLSDNTPPGVYSFSYGTDLTWLVWNEVNSQPEPTFKGKLRNPIPYESQPRGLIAFLHFADDVKLPVVNMTAKEVNL